MDRSKVKTVGFSIVRQDGDFALELDWIKAVNLPNTLGDRDISMQEQAASQYTGQSFFSNDIKDPTRKK
jgi:hypothetical protein